MAFRKIIFLALLGSAILQAACSSSDTKSSDGAPGIFGEREVKNGDTVYYSVPQFSFLDQDSVPFNNDSLKGQIYVVDFFFTSCPSICPKQAVQMLSLYQKYKNNPVLRLVSFSIDHRYDHPARLKRYAHKLGVSDRRWVFLEGVEDTTSALAEKFLSFAKADIQAPGGYDHSGRFILVDDKGHIRGSCDGTDPASVEELTRSIDFLLHEKK